MRPVAPASKAVRRLTRGPRSGTGGVESWVTLCRRYARSASPGDFPDRPAPAPPRRRRRGAVRGGAGDEPHPLHLPDDSDHGGDHLGDRGAGSGTVPPPRGGTHPRVRRRAGAVLRAARAHRRSERAVVRHDLGEPLGPLRGRDPAAAVRPGDAGRVSDPGAAAARGVGGATHGRILPGGVPVGRGVGDRGGLVRRARVRGRPDVGRGDAKRGGRVRLSLRVLARHDGGAGRRRRVLRARDVAAAGGPVDGMDQAGGGCGTDRGGGVLSHSGGEGAVRPTAWGRGGVGSLVLALLCGAARPGPLAAQEDELGIAVGARPLAVQAPSTSYVVVLDATGKVAYTGAGEDQDVEGAVQKAITGGNRR